MQSRCLRRIWFAGIWLLFPWPLLVYSDASVPAIRYLLLGAVAALVAVTEGSAGPVRLLVLLFLGWGIATTLLSWFLAFAISKIMDRLPSPLSVAVTATVLAAILFWALFFEPYRTPFGRALHGGLLQVLS